jgi:hypothetical protein
MGAVIRLPGTLAQSQIALSNEAMNMSTKIFYWFIVLNIIAGF